MAGKSLILTYIFWAIGGWFGLHHFYLGRDRQAFVWWCLIAGYGGVGWFGDIFRIPRYVEEANFTPEYVEKLTNKMKKNPTPPFSLYRSMGQVLFGNLLAWILHRAIPVDETLFGLSFNWLHIIIPIGSAVGVHTVGNIGREEGSIRLPLLGAFIPYIAYTAEDPKYYYSSVLAAVFFRWAVRWNRKPPKKRHLCKRLAIIGTCGLIYMALWSSYLYFNLSIVNEHGEEIKFRDSVKNLLQSPLWKKFADSLRALWTHYSQHGWHHIWDEVIKALDPFGETNALEVLDLPNDASQEEITKRWRELSRKYHPDKFPDPAEKLAAQEKFLEIKEAYEKISVINTKRKSRSSRSRGTA